MTPTTITETPDVHTLRRIDGSRYEVDGRVYVAEVTKAGMFSDFAGWVLQKNWRTSLAGACTLFFGFVTAYPHWFPAWLPTLSTYLAINSAGIGLILSKDSNRGSNLPTSELPPQLRLPDDKPAPRAPGSNSLIG